MFKLNLWPKSRILNARRYKRIRAAYLVKYHVNGKAGPTITNARDVSAGGLRFWTEEKLNESSVLNISVYVPPLDRAVDAVAEVLRIRRAKKGLVYYVGVCFLDLRQEDKEAINEFAEALSRDKEAKVVIDHADIVIRRK
ncbi:MAG: PilZ domain-containing protein [Candidatus Omnitrophica bacterium]|nr:PilZ domain-containing protein [Candidatus Omnitrophota bacterium]